MVTALIIAGLGIVVVLPPTGPILAWLGENWAVAFVIAASIFTLSTARRRQRASMAAATSWLAPLPVRVPVRTPIVLVTAAWLGALAAFAVLEWIAGAIGRTDFLQLVFALAAGALVGLLGGWRLPRTGIGAPGFHYAVVRRARTRWASAPSLSPLANWPAAQGRIFGRPRKAAPIVLLAMLAMPMGSPGQAAIAVAGVCLALFSVLTLSVAAVRVAFGAARWLAPTTVGRWRFTAALIWRAALIQTLTLAVLILLAAALNPSRTIATAVPLAVLYLGLSLAVVTAVAYGACLCAGLGTSARGA